MSAFKWPFGLVIRACRSSSHFSAVEAVSGPLTALKTAQTIAFA
jgi:hypothetical protein